MNDPLRWFIAIIGWLALLVVYSVWEHMDKATGGGFVSGALRGLIVFGGAFYLYTWAKLKPRKGKGMDDRPNDN